LYKNNKEKTILNEVFVDLLNSKHGA